MASNYALHFHLALNFRLCTLKMLQLLGDSDPSPPDGVLPLDPTAKLMNKTFAAVNQDNNISSVRPALVQ